SFARGSIDRYTDISCPSQVGINTPRVSVAVRLVIERPSYSAAVGAIPLPSPGPGMVRVGAPGFDVLNEPVQTIDVPADRDSTPAVFDLRPRLPGQGRVTIDFLRAGNPLGTVTVAVEIRATCACYIGLRKRSLDRGSSWRLSAGSMATN